MHLLWQYSKSPNNFFWGYNYRLEELFQLSGIPLELSCIDKCDIEIFVLLFFFTSIYKGNAFTAKTLEIETLSKVDVQISHYSTTDGISKMDSGYYECQFDGRSSPSTDPALMHK